MFSVNINKLVNASDKENESLTEITGNLLNEMGNGRTLAVINGGVSAFKIAYHVAKTGKTVLFIDGDMSSNVFLGKYKLGKDMKGLVDYLKKPDNKYELICLTNNDDMDIIFTGGEADTEITDDEKMILKSLLDKYLKEYDYIVLNSDEEGTMAMYCSGAVMLVDESQYDETEVEQNVEKLETLGCNVLGVVINE
ncbi:MAG: AAA family ATPase [Eubacteriales bacterium]|nr:AAA family ATPase [Eubacteriales bacterium]